MGRQVKRRKTVLEKCIKTIFRRTKKGGSVTTQEEKDVVLAIDITLFFLRVFDRMNLTRHKDYFIKRYLSLHNNMTQTELAAKTGECEDVIGDYCKKYIEVFNECFDIIKKLTAKITKIGNEPQNLIRIITSFLLSDEY